MGYHPWFEPLWRRLLVVAFCVGWLGFEWWQEPGGFWLWIAAGVTMYAAVDFFLRGKYGAAGIPPGSR